LSRAFFSVWLPGQTFEDALKTLDFITKNHVKVQGNTTHRQMQIYFGTRICQYYREYGIRPLEKNDVSYLSIGSRYETEWLSEDEIQSLHLRWKESSLDGGKRLVS